MPDPIVPPDAPIRVTDKREQRRLEAEAARERAQEQAAFSSTEEPGSEGVSPLEDDTALADTTARIDRIQELREKHGQEGGLTSEEGQELMQLQAEQEEADKQAANTIEALTAFVVIIGYDGSAMASHDLNQLIVMEREATTNDMFSGASLVVRDIGAAVAAQQVIFGLNVSAQAMKEKAAAVQQAQMLSGQVPMGGRGRGGGRRR